MSSAPHRGQQDSSSELDPKIINAASFKGPKRKRLLKACDACHKSKRRCDGTAPCSNCYFASKECTYTDGSGRAVPAPNAPRPELVASSSTSVGPSVGVNVFPQHLQSPDTMLSGPLTTAPLRYPNLIGAAEAHASTFHVQTTPGGSQHGSATQDASARPHPRKRARDQQDAEGPHYNFKVEPIHQPYAHTHDSRQSRIHDVPQDAIPHWSHSGAGGSRLGQHGIDRSVMRELVNLFFAHCHPHRLIIHSPTFLNDLYLDRVPGYLLNAVCALAAPLSRNPRIRCSPVRQAGQRFAREALEAIFDGQQQLKAPIHLHTAQALALLQSYLIYESGRMEGEFHLFTLAFRILDSLNIHSPAPPPPSGSEQTLHSPVDPNHPILTPMPSPEVWINAVQRECARRTFWFIHLVELLGFIFVHRRPTHSPRELRRNVTGFDAHKSPGTQAVKDEGKVQNSPSMSEGLRIRLPCSEAEFEVSVYSALPEYLNSAAPTSRNASEFGHLIRITTILVEIEDCNAEVPDTASVGACEDRLKAWATGLSEHLQYSQENLDFQLSLWETSSNTTTWCFCFMHILNACCILALNDIRRRLGHGQSHEYGGALDAVLKIMTGIGSRARNSIIMGSVLWLQHCGPHARPNGTNGNPEGGTVHAHKTLPKPPSVPELQSNLEGWIKEWEEIWGPMQDGHMQAASTQDEKQQVSTEMPERQWTVPEVVIDPLLRNEASGTDQRVPAARTGSQVLPLTSLPSLKASGLLDVVPTPDEGGSVAGRSSPWSASASSVSPRMPLRSPALLPHPHLSPNPSVGSSSPLPSSASSRSLEPPSISPQDRSRGAIDPYAPAGMPQPHFVDDMPGGSVDRGQVDYVSSNRQWSNSRTQHPSKIQAPPIVVPSHSEAPSHSPRRKHPDSL